MSSLLEESEEVDSSSDMIPISFLTVADFFEVDVDGMASSSRSTCLSLA